ncbi:D-2-hydroxyglutarate dehydrogenase YdiJ [Motilimonas eburnea]|uniref:D-2-hydroxyglutarate dehydrogenase YdiJ n=1 Tax=Motilimonas eburnea TaxID=1737488 RepID=UPI001E5BDBD3|nr:FAD-binding and (Fe-S)-binding domain-containing protein [Motilimonas eburnea]MCE2573217.1 FAD-binding oxidoreductase [Motilimonas eburnea]
MIPILSHQENIDSTALSFLDALAQAGFAGDIEKSYASRLAVATDNSVYQSLPQAVVLPKHQQDIVIMTQLASQPAYAQVRFSPRGGGTGTNGQSLTQDIVVDLSRYMNQVLEVNAEEGWVRVQTGVIKDQLNDALRPHGFFFSPDLSTSNRATVGGMINTDASGQGSLKYGKTSDHVLELTTVLVDGTVLESTPQSNQAAKQLAEQSGTIGNIYRQVLETCENMQQEIEQRFPKLNRFLTGYDLKHVYDVESGAVDLSRILCGSEGSLGFITEAKLNITPIPKYRALINVKYDSFESALRNAPFLVKANALSVETVDSKVLNLAKQDIVWHSVSDLIQDVPNKEMDGLNMVEYAEQDEAKQQQKIASLCQLLDDKIAKGEDGIIGYQVCDDLAGLNRIYAMRKKAVGLLGAAKGRAKPVAFAEDTCVPPENLADFIMEFRALLDSKGLNYGMFGHVDAGVLHVRPALDMCDPLQETLMREVSDKVVALTAKYKGLMWGEHGKGFRSEYGPEFFGETLFNELRKIKAAFDPYNRVNPGKICTPFASTDQLVSVDAVKRGFYDRQIPVQVRDSFTEALDCNGNGLCFNYDASSPMCPSSKITQDRRHSPKGRAGLMREWLRQLVNNNVDIIQLEKELLAGKNDVSLVKRFANSWSKKRGQYDFSAEVMEAMEGCLACKACSSQCPIKVDVPTFRSRFMFLYYSRYQRSIKDYLVGYSEAYTPLMAKAPGLFNVFLKQNWVQKLATKATGMVDIPVLSQPTLARSLAGHSALNFDLDALNEMSAEQRSKTVLIVQDPFTSYYDADVVRDLVLLAEKLGFNPVILPFKPNGKPQHIKGFLQDFAKTAKNAADFLNQIAQLNIPMIGTDPALVLCYRDEYNKALGDDRGQFKVELFQEWLTPRLAELEPFAASNMTFYLFGHCTEKTNLPNSTADWQQIFTAFGAQLKPVSVGCCGMAGTYGHDAKQYENSKGIYSLSWQQELAKHDMAQCLATGYSCRSQVKRFEGEKLKHPVQALLSLL